MSKTLSQSIKDPFDTLVFENTTNWARYVVVVRVPLGDDSECSATLANLRAATPPSFQRFWQLHRLAPRQTSVDHAVYLFTWLGPQRLIAIIRLSDSHGLIKQIVRVDNSEIWCKIGECTDLSQRNQAEIHRLWHTNHGNEERNKLAHRTADKIVRDKDKLEKEIEKLYTKLIA